MSAPLPDPTSSPREPETTPPTRWERVGWGDKALVRASDGYILGRVSSAGRTCRAYTSLAPLGEYISEEDARRAVERASLVCMEDFRR